MNFVVAPPKILVFSKTAGFRHDSIEVGVEALKKMGLENNWQVDATEDSKVFTVSNLKKYKAVVFLNTIGDILNEEQQKAFEQYIKKGGGFVGIHAASDTEYGWPWFGNLVGAYFLDHPNNPNVKPAKFDVVHAEHWATAHMASTFSYTDEFYNFKSIPKNVETVLTIDEKSYTGGKHPDFHPMSWYHEYDGGRAFYTALGHTKASYSDSLFLNHVKAGLNYVMKKM